MNRHLVVSPGTAAAPFAALGIDVAPDASRAHAYAYVWMPAPGVAVNADDAARLFAVCDHLQLDLAQPAFAADARVLHPVARRHAGFQLRFTTLVDPAAPVFSARLLAAVRVERSVTTALDWARATVPGRTAVVDAVCIGGQGSVPADVAAYNLGGLLDSGDGCCLSERRDDVDALLGAVLHASRTLDAGTLARYLAAHLADPHAGLPARLEQELAAAAIGFNRVPVPAFEAPVSREAALVDADLRDLRRRHGELLAERDRQAALLAALVQELRRAGAAA